MSERKRIEGFRRLEDHAGEQQSRIGYLGRLLIFALTLAPGLNAQQQPVAFVDVTVVPMDKEQVLPHETVIAAGGRIAIDDRYYRMYFMRVPLARFDSRRLKVERLRPQDREEET